MNNLHKSEIGKSMEKEANTANGILTRMFRKIIFDTGLARSLMYFIDKYKAEGGGRAKTSIVKTITSPEMTWKYFIFLLFEVLRAKKLKIRLEIEWPNDTITEHELEVSPIKLPKKTKKDTRGRKPKYDQNKINELLGIEEDELDEKINPKEILGDEDEDTGNVEEQEKDTRDNSN